MERVKRIFRGQKAALVTALGGMAAIAVTLVLVEPAGAIPASQSVCEAGSILDAPAPEIGPVPLTGARSITVSSPQTVKVEVTADVGVDSGAEVRLAWSVNGAAAVEGGFGPANFADHMEFFQTRSTFALINVGSGTTTIQPIVRVSGSNDKRATLLHRCFTIQAAG